MTASLKLAKIYNLQDAREPDFVLTSEQAVTWRTVHLKENDSGQGVRDFISLFVSEIHSVTLQCFLGAADLVACGYHNSLPVIAWGTLVVDFSKRAFTMWEVSCKKMNRTCARYSSLLHIERTD